MSEEKVRELLVRYNGRKYGSCSDDEHFKAGETYIACDDAMIEGGAYMSIQPTETTPHYVCRVYGDEYEILDVLSYFEPRAGIQL